jgi:hypothetical protein
MIITLAFALLLAAGEQAPPASGEDPCSTVTCRPAGDVEVRLDRDTGMTVSFPRMPYAFKHAIYVLVGEAFSVKYPAVGQRLGHGVYVPPAEPKPAGIHVRLWQEQDGSTILAIENTTKRTVVYEIAMQLPKESRLRKTTALPVEAGLTNYEQWPHPVAQLLLYNVRLEGERPEGAAER